MSRIRANKITNKAGTGAIELEKGAHIPVGMGITGAGAINISGAITGGVITGSSFSGDGSGLIGVASTDNIITGTAATFNTFPVDINAGMTVAGVSTFGAITATSFGAVSGTTGAFSGNVSVGGVLTYEDVTNVDSVGIITARSSIKLDADGSASSNFLSIGADDDLKIFHQTNVDKIESSANGFHIRQINGGDIHIHAGANTGTSNNRIVARTAGQAELYHSGNIKLATSSTGVSVTGTVAATAYTGDGSALTGITVGLTTEALVKTNGQTASLDLSKDDHKVTATGTVTIDVTGGTEAGSHTLRVVNSGIATVGFSTYFLFPSGGTPNLPTASGAISLISFTVHRAGAVGVSTQLLSGASVNFS